MSGALPGMIDLALDEAALEATLLGELADAPPLVVECVRQELDILERREGLSRNRYSKMFGPDGRTPRLVRHSSSPTASCRSARGWPQNRRTSTRVAVRSPSAGLGF